MTSMDSVPGSVRSQQAKDALYEKIGKFLEAHPEAMDMSTDESDRLFERWVKGGKE